jgi:hypothetical protein
MNRSLIRCGALALAVGLGACELAVQNPNNPETDRVLATPADVENLLGTQYLRWHSAMYGSTGNVWGMSAVQSHEDFSSLSNNCLGQRVGIPRAGNDNQIGNGCASDQRRVYYIASEVTRIASNVLDKLDEDGFTLGTAAQDARARAFAHFVRGLALGYLAMTYDSAAIVTPGMSGEDAGELVGYQEVNAAALDGLQTAVDLASNPPAGANGFPLPTTWLPSPTSITAAEFVRLARSYKARLRATVARTAAERAAVDWDAVIADAQNGITADHQNVTNTITGPFNSWVSQFHTFTTWHQMTPFVIGMADNSGAYAAWTAQALAARGASGPFFMVTPDLRFPQGATRAAQQADFAITSCSGPSQTCKRYFVNRPSGNDTFSGDSWGYSNYDFVRFYSWKTSGAGTARNGPIVFMTKAEIDLLEAEGQYRKGNFAAAAALINKTRVARGGLPAITAFDATSPVPGGADCVPKVPSNAGITGGGTIACGNMLEALKWEKRIETAYTHYMAWFIDSRGWNDLTEGTGVHWAAPFEDLQARGRTGAQIYSTGGTSGNTGSAPKGTYGW